MKPRGRSISAISIAVLIVLFYVPLSAAQDMVPAVRFIHLTIEDGLSQSTVTAILQDSQGFMWIGTMEGLNRYDGHTFTVYQYDPDDPNSLSDNHILDLYQDATGAIWVATRGGGVNRFDPHTETFTRYRHDPQDPNSLAGDNISFVFQDRDGDLWFGGPPLQGGLSRFDLDAEIFVRSQSVRSPNTDRGGIWEMIEDADGRWWAAADFGLSQYDPEQDQFTDYAPGTGDRRIAAIAQDQSGKLWIGGSLGLYHFDPQTHQFKLYQPGGPIIVHDILLNPDGTLWVSSGGHGIYLFDIATGRFTRHYTHDPAEPSSLRHDNASILYRDRSGVLWIGTDDGLSLYNPRQTQFSHYRHDPSDPNSLGGQEVWGLSGDEMGNVWIGAGVTLHRLDLDRQQLIPYFLESMGAGSSTVPKGDIYCDPGGAVWIGIQGRLYHLDSTSGQFTSYDIQAAHPPNAPPITIHSLYRDGPYLWIGAQRGGLMRFAPDSEILTTYLAPAINFETDPNVSTLLNYEVTVIYRDWDRSMWVGYATGALSHLDPDTGALTHYLPNAHDPDTIPSGWITDIHRDRAGVLWLASRRGLTHFVETDDAGQGTFTLYTKRDGLPSAHVTSIQEYRDGTLWLATMRGLSHFDPQTETFRNYDVDEGIGSTEFLGPSWQSADGRLFFGGKNGLTVFDPDRLVDSTYHPPVVLTQFYLFHQPVQVGEDSLLERPIWETEHLTLAHNQNTISFEFATLSYAAPQKHRYRYMLQGAEETWNTVDDHHLAAYTHLPAGEYVFRVQGTNDDGVWSEHQASLPITIVPPWWDTWWFRGGVIVLLIGLVTAGMHWRTTAFKRQRRALQTEVAERTKELVVHTEQLQKSEERFSTVMNSMQSLMYVADMETYELLFVNQTVRDLFEGAEGDICWQVLQGEQPGPCSFCTNEHLLENGQSTGVYTWEFQNTATGLWYYIQDRAIRWIDGRWARLEVATDITDRVRAERELAAALDTARRLRVEAETANRAKSVFLANMSHELRTPLNAILGYAQLMGRDTHITPTQQDYLDTIARSGEHLLELINDILTMSKIEAGRTTLQENAFDLYRQLSSLHEMFQMRADDKGLTLLLDIAPTVPHYIQADESKLRQVLMNLLSNAVKFTAEGGVAIRVRTTKDERTSSRDRLSPMADHCVLLIEIEDTGPGIALEEQKNLFAPFVQTASGRQSQEGTGLGLPICQQFVQLMGGEIDIHSIAGHGTIFRVQIPVSLANADDVQVLDPQSQRRVIDIAPDQVAPDGGPFRILVVEDKPTNSTLLVKLLEPFGLALRCAANGQQGVEMWETWQPHLVWMDMRMPVMDGYEATRQIKARAAATGCTVIIIALTASAFEENRAAVLAAGCDDFVRKPFRESEIFDVLHRYLGIRFLYQDTALGSEDAAHMSHQALRDTIQTLPPTWAADLHQATIALNTERMLALIEDVRPQAPHLADTLAGWIRNFEYERLMELVDPNV